MRLAGLVMLATAVVGKPMSCNEWAEGPGNVVVTFDVPEGPGTRGITLRGCRGWEGSEGQLVLPPGQSGCWLVGWRKDGQLRVESEPILLDKHQLEQHVVFNDLPEGPIAGMGALVERASHGIRIEHVLWGFPAHRAGIAPGDVLVAINDEPTLQMSTTDFIRKLTGPPGGMVVLSVESPDGALEKRSIVRERIP